MKRKGWVENFKSEMKDIGGLTSLFGGLVAASATVMAVPAIAIGGVVITGGGILVAGFRAIPDKLESPKKYVKKTIKIDKLNDVEPILRVGVIGNTKSGKSTLLDKMQLNTFTNERTDELYATILMPIQSSNYIAFIDGAGQEYTQQFTIIDNSDFLLLLVDHNGEDGVRVSNDRLNSHQDFIVQMIQHINKNNMKKQIHLLLNKEDKWSVSNTKEALLQRFEEYKQLLSQNPLVKLTSSSHSNFIDRDIANIWDKLNQEVENANNK